MSTRGKRWTVLVMLALVGLLSLTGVSGALPASEARSVGVVGTRQLGLDLDVSPRLTNLEPGSEYWWNATVTNTGDAAVYLRVRVELAAQWKERPPRDLTLEELGVSWLDGWVAGEDGHHYYGRQLAPGQSVRLFDELAGSGGTAFTLRLPRGWNNLYGVDAENEAPKSFALLVTPDAVQADNFTAQFGSWPFWAM